MKQKLKSRVTKQEVLNNENLENLNSNSHKSGKCWTLFAFIVNIK